MTPPARPSMTVSPPTPPGWPARTVADGHWPMLTSTAQPTIQPTTPSPAATTASTIVSRSLAA